MVYLAPIETQKPRACRVYGDRIEAGENLVHGRFASSTADMGFSHSDGGVQHAEVRLTVLIQLDDVSVEFVIIPAV